MICLKYSVGSLIKDKVCIQFNIGSIEFNSKWYTEVRAWKIELNNPTQNNTEQPQSPTPTEVDDLDILFNSSKEEDHPF